VRLADDFFEPDERPYPREEANLLYVAVTRAMDWLDPGAVARSLGELPVG
jgi:ATP-dependent exoDNAse (exonuclease V) beta subunit